MIACFLAGIVSVGMSDIQLGEWPDLFVKAFILCAMAVAFLSLRLIEPLELRRLVNTVLLRVWADDKEAS